MCLWPQCASLGRLSYGSHCSAAHKAQVVLSPEGRTWGQTAWEKLGQQGRKTWLPLVSCRYLVGIEMVNVLLFQHEECTCSGWQGHFSPWLTSTGLCRGRNCPDRCPAPLWEGLTWPHSVLKWVVFMFADRGWWISLISPCSPLPSGCAQGCEACGAAAPSLAEAKWPFPMKPEGLSSDSLLQCDCHTISWHVRQESKEEAHLVRETVLV